MQKIVLIVSFFLLLGVNACVHRNYSHGSSTVCVCNSTVCDNFPPIIKTPKGVVTAYVSSKNGDRFTKESVTQFSKLPVTHVVPTVSITLDKSKKYQNIIGFGGAFTDSAGINIAKLPKDMQTRLIKDYFGADGIEFQLGRVPIGGSDFSTRPYSYDDHPNDDNLTMFALQPEDVHFKIPYIKMANELSPHKVKIYASPWSPPAWMKTNKKFNEGGFLIGEPGTHYWKIWAKYFVKFLDEYKKNKVDIWGITIQNEPEAGYIEGFKWNSLAINQTLERDFIKLDLGPELHKNAYKNLKVMIHDGQLPLAKDFVEPILSDKDAEKYVHGIAFHWYLNFIANWTDLDELNKKYPNQFLLATEACQEAPEDGSGDATALGSWNVFNRYAVDIIKDLNHFTTGWTTWNLALSTSGGPNWALNFVSSPIIVNETSQEYYKNPTFYAMGHFSKFLVSDSVRIHHEAKTTDQENIMVTSFVRPDNGTVVIVLNKNNHSIIAQVNDPLNGYATLNIKPEALYTMIWY